MAAITGTAHPLTRRIWEGKRAITRTADLTERISRDERKHGIGSGTVYELLRADGFADASGFRRIGPTEDYGHLLDQPDYVVVYATRRPRGELAEAISIAASAQSLPGNIARAQALHDAAVKAAPMVAALLAVCVQGEVFEWDTDESVAAAGARIALDAAYDALGQGMPIQPVQARDIWSLVLTRLNVVDRPAADYAGAYLEQRDTINATLAEQGIEWGGTLLDAAAAADRAGITRSTWTAYVARTEAPAGDAPKLWRLATVDAWRLTRPRAVSDW